MRLPKRKSTGREKDEEAIELLERLRTKLYSDNTSTARHSAFNLSWMQEDGLEILSEALFGVCDRRTRTAAAYGLRKMRGRMKNPAREALERGAKHADKEIRGVCQKSLELLKSGQQKKSPKKRRRRKQRFQIRENSHERPPRNARRNVGNTRRRGR